MSTSKTTNYALNQWDRSDLFLMEEFNADNAILDEALANCSLVKLSSEKLTASAASWSLDLSEWGASNYTELRIHLSGWHNSTGLQPFYLSMNGVENSSSYLSGNLTQGSTLSTGSGILVGKLAGSASSNHGGLEIILRLHSKGVTVLSVGLCCTSDTNAEAFHCVGSPSSTTVITRSNLKSLKLFFDSSTSIQLAAGAVMTVYGRKG